MVICGLNTKYFQALEHAHNVFVDSLKQAEEDLESLRVLDAEIKEGGATVNPYTWFTMQALDETWDNLKKIVTKRELELKEEHRKQVCYGFLSEFREIF